MTSPAQLKYLEAIGIPVWVSRDKVIIESFSTSAEHLSTEGEVEKILHDLDDQVEVRTQDITPQITPKQTAPPLAQPQHNDLHANEIARTASHIVYASGSLQADWMVIGESPELHDDRFNQPYAGELGILLSNMLLAVGLDNPQKQAYRVNVIKSSMQTDTVDAASIAELNQLLVSKIKEVKPKIVLIVGQLAAQNLLQCREPLARLRAKPQKITDMDINAVATYYPSHLLSKPLDKRKAWEDLKLAMRLIA